MAKVILGSTMSLDGYINDRSGSVGGLRLFEQMELLRLERIRVEELPGGRTHLEFRIIK